MLLIYIDIILLIVLVTLTICMVCFCIFHMNRLHKGGRVTIVVHPRRDKHDDTQRLHTVVSYGSAYSARAHVAVPPASPRASPRASSDSGLSDAYEPLDPPDAAAYTDRPRAGSRCASAPLVSPSQYNRITRSWNWNYKEYQI